MTSAMAFSITILRAWRSKSFPADILIWLVNSRVGRLWSRPHTANWWISPGKPEILTHRSRNQGVP
ncbi:MAG: hypothetical protein OXC26_04965 [Albidovulum sp.]|nr:hypothetical protein [Albidovulum sp.]